MPQKISRRKLAKYAAAQILSGDESVVDELAALLVEERREREAEVLIHDIEDELADHGVLVVIIETAKPIDDNVRKSVTSFLQDLAVSKSGAKTRIHLKEVVNPDVIGGIRIRTPSSELDATVAKKLNDLRSRKV